MLVMEKWEEILLMVKTEYDLSNIVYDSWIKPLKIHEIIDNSIYILVPSDQIALNYIKKKYATPLKVVIEEITGENYEIVFVLPEDARKLKPVKSTAIGSTVENAASVDDYNLNPDYTFDTFVVGNNNQLAHTISLVVAEEAANPEKKFNPLFLWGDVGLGKTHLMHSIAHHILANHPQLKIQYVSSEVFTNEVIEAIRSGSNSQIKAIREKYRNVDVLLIDDIQFVIGKDRTQEEFFNTFNVLYNAGKQIVISSDKPPKEMLTLEERFRSRFQWGCMADISTPDYETRMAILRKKEELDNFELDDEIIQYIANNIKSNIRELEGALNRLMAFSRLQHETITIETAKEQLESIINPDLHKVVTPELIVKVVAEHFQKTPKQLLAKSRSSDIAKPRQIAMYLCKQMTETSLTDIGRVLGGRDHSTVIHGIEKIENQYNESKEMQNLIETIRKKINPN